MAEIHVLAQFPVSGQPSSLDLSSDHFEWIHCLTFPVAKLNQLQLSLKPYKWIRYATGAVVGAYGELSTRRDSTVPVDYNADLPSEPLDLYYRTVDEERVRMFPVDPQLANTRISSSTASTRWFQFREDVKRRDQGRCVFSGTAADFCDAAHLVPHRKGDSFIRLITQGRSRRNDDVIEDIDDVRNGVFLRREAHMVLGTNLAILKTPNFAMKTTDVDPEAPSDEPRYTAHFFNHESMDHFGQGTRSRLRTPADLSNWPSEVLFDIVYGSTVTKHFGVIDEDDPHNAWRNIFYPKSTSSLQNETVHDAETHYQDNRSRQDKARDEQARDRAAWRERHQDRADWALDAIALGAYMFMPPEEVKTLVQKRRKEREAAERKELESKISMWRNDIQ